MRISFSSFKPNSIFVSAIIIPLFYLIQEQIEIGFVFLCADHSKKGCLNEVITFGFVSTGGIL